MNTAKSSTKIILSAISFIHHRMFSSCSYSYRCYLPWCSLWHSYFLHSNGHWCIAPLWILTTVILHSIVLSVQKEDWQDLGCFPCGCVLHSQRQCIDVSSDSNGFQEIPYYLRNIGICQQLPPTNKVFTRFWKTLKLWCDNSC